MHIFNANKLFQLNPIHFFFKFLMKVILVIRFFLMYQHLFQFRVAIHDSPDSLSPAVASPLNQPIQSTSVVRKSDRIQAMPKSNFGPCSEEFRREKKNLNPDSVRNECSQDDFHSGREFDSNRSKSEWFAGKSNLKYGNLGRSRNYLTFWYELNEIQSQFSIKSKSNGF